MTVADLIQMLRELERLLGAAGAAGQQRELGALADALNSKAEMNLNEWSEGFAASTDKAKSTKPQKPLNQAAIDIYVQELRAASTSEGWASVTAKMKNDKVLDKRHLAAVASQFIGREVATRQMPWRMPPWRTRS